MDIKDLLRSAEVSLNMGSGYTDADRAQAKCLQSIALSLLVLAKIESSKMENI